MAESRPVVVSPGLTTSADIARSMERPPSQTGMHGPSGPFDQRPPMQVYPTEGSEKPSQNEVSLGKRPFFLFAHSQSLYAFFVAAAGNSPLDAFGRAFRDQLAAALVREGVAATLGARLMDDGPDTICRNGDWVSRRSSGWLGTDGALAQGGDSRQQKDTRRKSTSRTGRICYHDVIW